MRINKIIKRDGKEVTFVLIKLVVAIGNIGLRMI